MAEDADNDDNWLYGDAPDIPGLDNNDKSEDELLNAPGDDGDASMNDTRTQEEENALLNEPDSKTDKEHEVESDEKNSPEGNQPEPSAEDNHQFEDAPVADADEDADNDPPPPGVEDEMPPRSKSVADSQGDGTEDSEDDSDDDVNVVIGDIKTTNNYSSSQLNIKRSGLISSTALDKSKQIQAQTGKFTIDEFEQMGFINGIAAAEFSMDSLEDKPWRKPGADITDYFNYGFNEDTWKAYCERQKRIRINDSGVGLMPLNAIGLPRGPMPIPITDNRGMMPPGMRMDNPKENVIQVMTADRREYSRKPPGFPDLSMPPPGGFDGFQPEFGFNPEPEPFYGGYEPTQDLQWAPHDNNPNWQPNEIKPLTSGPAPAPVPPVSVHPMGPPHHKDSSPTHRDSRERDRDRERDRGESRCRSEKPRDRDRERSHRRERSRSRSRRHRSRSRSPSHHSSRHKKKKSRRHEDSD